MFVSPVHRSVISGAPPPIITDGLLHHWPCDDGSGNEAADSQGGPPLTLTNGPIWYAPGLIGRYSHCIEFDGVNQYAISPSTNSGIDYDPFTVCLFVYVIQFSFLQYCGGHTPKQPMISPDISAGNWGSSFTNIMAASVSLSINTVYHLAVARDASDNIFHFLDGVEDPTPYSDSGRVWPSGKMIIGAYSDSTGYCKMRGNDLRLYDRRLSNAEIAQIAAGNG